MVFYDGWFCLRFDWVSAMIFESSYPTETIEEWQKRTGKVPAKLEIGESRPWCYGWEWKPKLRKSKNKELEAVLEELSVENTEIQDL